VGIRAGEDSELDRRELMDPEAILTGLVTADQKTMSLPRVDGRAVEKSRENRSSGSHQRPRGDGRHGCHEVLARMSGRGHPFLAQR